MRLLRTKNMKVRHIHLKAHSLMVMGVVLTVALKQLEAAKANGRLAPDVKLEIDRQRRCIRVSVAQTEHWPETRRQLRAVLGRRPRKI